MNSRILELIFHPFFSIGLIIVLGIILLYIMYKDIIEHNKTICPICGKETINQIVCNFRRKGKIYRVHCGDCADIFLYGENFYQKRFLDTLDESVKDRFQRGKEK